MTTEAGTSSLGFTPSNVSVPDLSAAGDVALTAACDIDTDRLVIPCVARVAGSLPYTFAIAQQADGSQVGVLGVHSLVIQPSAVASVTGSIPLVIVAQTTVNVQGSLIANTTASHAATNGGGARVTASGTGGGPGGGGGEGPDYVAAGGGGYCGMGGNGANSHEGGAPTPGGKTYGNAMIAPLTGGSAGGAGGAGGGAIQITAGMSILIGSGGVIGAPGDGSHGSNGGAGGSGGSILLEAPSVTVNGVLAANGGGGDAYHGGDNAQDGQPNAQPAVGTKPPITGNGGAGAQVDGTSGTSTGPNDTGGGGGGVGRIRINTTSGAAVIGASAVISPATSTQCTTQGTL